MKVDQWVGTLETLASLKAGMMEFLWVDKLVGSWDELELMLD